MHDAPVGTFGRIAAAVMKHPKGVTAGLVVACLLAILAATRLEVNPNILDLLPEGDPTTQAIQELNAQEGGANLLTIAITGQDTELVPPMMRKIVTELQSWPEVDYAIYEIDPDLAWRVGLLQLAPSDLSSIRDRLKGAIALGPAAANPFVAGRLLDLGPLTARLKDAGATASLTGKGGIARVLVRPRGSAYDPAFSRPFLKKVQGMLDGLHLEEQGLRLVWLGGAYRHAVEDLEGIIHDLQFTGAASLVLVLLIVTVAFRDIRALTLIFVPLGIGTIWTFGFTGLAIGTLNTFTSYSGAVLLGMGVDFAVHLYARYREERAQGGELEDAVIRAWDAVGPPCLTAGLTTSGGFAALWVAHFQGFVQLGTILAAGVLFCLLAVVITLPLLIIWRESRPRAIPLRRVREPGAGPPPTYRLAPLFLILAAIVTLMCTTLAPRIGFEYDISELRPDGLSYGALDQEQRQLAESSYAPVIVSFPDVDSLAEAHVRLSEAVAEGKIPVLGSVLSRFSLLPIDQGARLSILSEIAELSRSENVQFLPAQVQQNLARIRDTSLAPMAVEELPHGVQQLLGAGGGHFRMVLIPKGNMWDLRENVLLADAISTWLPGRKAAGEFLASAMLYRLMQQDGPRVAGVALILVFFLTVADLRSLSRGTGAMLGLLAGMAWAAGGLALFKVDISLVNFVGIPILMGLGIDVVIHLLHRLHEEGPGRIRFALTTTGWAAAISSITTIASFASLTFASNQGVRSLGLIVVLGLTLITAAAFTVVPLGWMTVWKVRGDLPGE